MSQNNGRVRTLILKVFNPIQQLNRTTTSCLEISEIYRIENENLLKRYAEKLKNCRKLIDSIQ